MCGEVMHRCSLKMACGMGASLPIWERALYLQEFLNMEVRTGVELAALTNREPR
jgi:hypothetical protein